MAHSPPSEPRSRRSLAAVAGTADITPTTPVALAGSETRTGVFRAVSDSLEANALLLRHGGRASVLVTVDLVFAGRELRSGIVRRLGAALPDDRLFLAASHTHFAPATDDRRPRLGRLDSDYLEQVCDRVAALVHRLLESPAQTAVLEYVHGEADHAVNRRRRVPWQLSRRGLLIDAVVAAPNPAGPREETVHLIRVASEAGAPIAVLWSYACHPVGYPLPLDVTSEYPGSVRRGLRQELRADLPVLFLQGFAGDIRPRVPARRRSASVLLKRAVLGPRFGPMGMTGWQEWTGSLTARVVAIAGQPAVRATEGEPRVARISKPLAEFVCEASPDRDVTFHAVALGTEIVIVGISAEVVTGYVDAVRRAFAPAAVIPVGYIDEVYGYLPTSQMLREGGYEASWFLEPFGLEGPVHAEVERHTVQAIDELSAAVGGDAEPAP